jgi:glucan endo-1,3-alpha-glucosidase
VADAFAAAETLSQRGIHFGLFISFDMTSLPCSQPGDAINLQNYIKTYASHPNQLIYQNQALVSTFAGDACTFGMADSNSGWQYAVKSGPDDVIFIPAFFTTFPPTIDGAFNVSYILSHVRCRQPDESCQWNGGWPVGDNDINFTSDKYYLSNLRQRSYMASVSPWFFTVSCPAMISNILTRDRHDSTMALIHITRTLYTEAMIGSCANAGNSSSRIVT